MKKRVTNPYGVKGKKDGGDNAHQLKTSQKLADIHKVNERTIREDGRYAKAVDAVFSMPSIFPTLLHVHTMGVNP
jgi:hypothetical protein